MENVSIFSGMALKIKPKDLTKLNNEKIFVSVVIDFGGLILYQKKYLKILKIKKI